MAKDGHAWNHGLDGHPTKGVRTSKIRARYLWMSVGMRGAKVAGRWSLLLDSGLVHKNSALLGLRSSEGSRNRGHTIDPTGKFQPFAPPGCSYLAAEYGPGQ